MTTINPVHTDYICINLKIYPNCRGMLSSLYEKLQSLGTAILKLKLKKTELITESSKETNRKNFKKWQYSEKLQFKLRNRFQSLLEAEEGDIYIGLDVKTVIAGC